MPLDPKTNAQIAALAPVQSVNGETGAVSLSVADVGAQASDATLSALAAWDWSSGTEVPTLTADDTLSILRVGTAANNLVQLDGSAHLPAVDGASLTGMPYSHRPRLQDTNVWLYPRTTGATAGGTTVVITANVKYCVVIFVPVTYSFSQFRVRVTSFASGAEIRCGIRNVNAAGEPTTLVTEISAPLDASSNGDKIGAFSATLRPGMYFLEIVPSVTCTIVGFPSSVGLACLGVYSSGGSNVPIMGLSRAFTYGALPADETANPSAYIGSGVALPWVGIR